MQLKTLMEQEARVLLTAPNQGEVERLAGLLQEYGVPYRLGSRTQQAGIGDGVLGVELPGGGSADAGDCARRRLRAGVQVLDLRSTAATARQIVIFGAQDLSRRCGCTARPVTRKKSKTAAFISDFRDLAVGDYVVHVEHGIAQYCGLRVIEENDAPPLELMILEFADQAKLYVPLTRLDLIQKYRSTERGRRRS